MKGFVAVTDNDWFAFLSQQPVIDELNFWQPGGCSQLRRLKPPLISWILYYSRYSFEVAMHTKF